MAGHGEKMSRKQEQAVLALLTCSTIAEAARNIGVAENTLWRWMQDSEFKEKFNEAKRLAFGQALGRLQQASTMAVDTLESVMQDETAPASSRVSAAKTVLELSHKAFEIQDLAEKIEELEQKAAIQGK